MQLLCREEKGYGRCPPKNEGGVQKRRTSSCPLVELIADVEAQSIQLLCWQEEVRKNLGEERRRG